MKNTRKMVFLGLFISLQVILTRFLGIEAPIIRVSFGFLPLALCGMLFGPLYGGICGAIADILGMLIFPKGAYFPGFTLSTALSGVVYGIFLYKRPKSMINIILAVLIITIFINLGLNTIWLSMITGKAVYAIIVPRIIKNLIEIPVKVPLIYMCWKAIGHYMDKSFRNVAV
ncbi:folate family ECF transporter S component [Clostridium sp. BSD9I1]|uniref:folate family ECF transporter S component n=1 Tax=Clostridium sp. BSD9I1 TaxID=2003589 RepID=UPI001648006C|nr:folate family ECF transporter S component [Clostridium sp. BSD9I1]